MWHFDERGISRERQANEKETLSGRRELSVDPVVRGSGCRVSIFDPGVLPVHGSGSRVNGHVRFQQSGLLRLVPGDKAAPGGQALAGFCAQVLSCLNDVRCIKTYCNATTIRTGWKLEKVE